MPGVVSNALKTAMMTVLTGEATVQSRFVHIFVNNYSPDGVSEVADFTEPTTDPTYEPVEILYTEWETTDLGDVITSLGPLCVFSFTNSQSVYGYFLSNNPTTPTIIYWSERYLGAPLGYTGGGSGPQFRPRMSMGACSP